MDEGCGQHPHSPQKEIQLFKGTNIISNLYCISHPDILFYTHLYKYKFILTNKTHRCHNIDNINFLLVFAWNLSQPWTDTDSSFLFLSWDNKKGLIWNSIDRETDKQNNDVLLLTYVISWNLHFQGFFNTELHMLQSFFSMWCKMYHAFPQSSEQLCFFEYS